MAAPKNNQFWKLRDKDGRDKIFKTPESFLEAAYEYFEWADKNPWKKKEAIKSGNNAGKIIDIPTQRPYSIEALCLYVGITYVTFLNYESNENYKEYFKVFTHVREIIENNQFEGATVGAYNANIIARKLGLTEKTENVNKNLNQDLPELTPEEIKKINEQLEKEY